MSSDSPQPIGNFSHELSFLTSRQGRTESPSPSCSFPAARKGEGAERPCQFDSLTPFGQQRDPLQMISLSTYDANDEVYRGVAAPPSPFPPSLTKTLETSVESPSKDGGKDKDLRSPTLRTVESLSDSRSTSVPDWESFSDLYSPPEEPEYENFVFNRTTIFFTDSPAGVANRLATCLHMPKRGWEVHTCPATFKIRAVCNTSPESVMVEVLFFRSSFEGTKATAMEVRRLEGDALAFSRVFCGLKEQVRKSGVLLGSQGKGKGGRVDERSAGCVAVCSGVGGVDSWDDLIAPPSLDSLSPPIPAL